MSQGGKFQLMSPTNSHVSLGLVLPADARARGKSRDLRPRSNRDRGGSDAWILATAIALLVLVNILGLTYFTAPLHARVRSPLHLWFRPSGFVGQTAGIAAFVLFLFLWLYSLRKRFRWLGFIGPVARILRLHIVAGLVIPLLAATHAGWRFGGLAGLGYAAMLAVCLSGVIGRYIYVRAPRTREGLQMDLGEATSERGRLLQELADATGLSVSSLERMLKVEPVGPEHLGLWRTIRQMAADDRVRRRAVRAFIKDLPKNATGENTPSHGTVRRVARLANREVALGQQCRLLDATQRVFRFWHVAHMPVAMTTLVAVFMHVILTTLLGVTWLR